MTSAVTSDRDLSKFEKIAKNDDFLSNFSGAAFSLLHQLVGIFFSFFDSAPMKFGKRFIFVLTVIEIAVKTEPISVPVSLSISRIPGAKDLCC